VRRGYKDNPAHIWQWLDKNSPAQQIAPFRRNADLVDWLISDGLPYPVAGIDDHRLGKEATLAVADDNHLRQRRVGASRVEFVHGVSKRLAQ
jgi:hypothetical protein